MHIGEVAKRTGLSRDTLRYYEKIGLLAQPKKGRGENNYRIYDEAMLEKITLIKQLKTAGFTLNEIKDLFQMEELRLVSCNAVGGLINEKIARLEQQIEELQAKRNKLLHWANNCEGDCTIFLARN